MNSNLLRMTIVFLTTFVAYAVAAETSEQTEKQMAKEFLVRNMQGCYTFTSNNLTHYYSYLHDVFSSPNELSNNQYRATYAKALHAYPFVMSECDTLYDTQRVTEEYLQENINDAYSMWKKNSPHISFDTFCNYILPYRISCEPLSNWRRKYREFYSSSMPTYPARQYNYYHVFGMYSKLNTGFNAAVYYPTGSLPEFSLSDLLIVKLGNCESYSARSVAQLRAFGIPSTVDFVPQWGNRSMGHSWAVMFISDDYTLPFGINETLGTHFMERSELTMPKVYRKTLAKQVWLKDISVDVSPYVPSLFRDTRYIDVTEKYVNTSGVTVKIENSEWLEGVKWVYLGVFNNKKWVPVVFSRINKNKEAEFKAMGRGVVYVPFYYDKYGRQQYASTPFLLDEEGNVRKFIANTENTEKVVVTRKYWESETLKKYNRQLNGGKIVLSNDADFHDSIIVATIDGISENRYHTIPLQYKGEYKYLKYISPNGSYGNIAEIEMFDNNDSIVKPIRCFGGMGAWEEHSPAKVFDGNELTSYSRMSPNGAWAAVELPVPLQLSKIRIHPRTDGNAIYAGDKYQLYYWNNGRWNIVSEQTAGHVDSLIFEHIPVNSLLLLHNATRGSEERIFTYDRGKQVWW